MVGAGSGRMAAVPLADAFSYPGVASAYRHRPPYPDQVFTILTGLITDRMVPVSVQASTSAAQPESACGIGRRVSLAAPSRSARVLGSV